MNKCWCGSGLDYEVCHREFDKKINYYKKRGVMTPPRSMIKNQQQIEGIKKAAVVNNGLLDHIEKNIKIGMSTEDIDVLTREYLKEHNAHSADLNYEGYPKSICTSINDVVCHGIPSSDVILKDGDIINVDATSELNGYYADASRMFMMGNVSDEAKKLVKITKEAMYEGMKAIKPWKSHIGDIGKAIAVVLMVMQVAGSGGTFPIQCAPEFFRKVYPLLPFVHSMNAMRECIAGFYGMNYWIELGKLALFLIPALLLGLILRKPVIKLNDAFTEKLESTHLI